MRRITPLLLAVLVLSPLAATAARADLPADGLYGRFDGDLTLSIGAGAGLDASDGQAAFVGELRARYLDSAGLVLALEQGAPARLVAAADVRPLFPTRFLLNAWAGDAWTDLLLDSIGFELGAAIEALHSDGRGLALVVGAGLDVPLLLPGALADGLFLRLGGRWVHGAAQHVRGPAADASEWRLAVVLTLKGVVDLGLASREPPRYRP